MNSSLQVLLTMLRNAEKLNIVVTDEKGNIVKTIAEEEYVRGNYLESEENPLGTMAGSPVVLGRYR